MTRKRKTDANVVDEHTKRSRRASAASVDMTRPSSSEIDDNDMTLGAPVSDAEPPADAPSAPPASPKRVVNKLKPPRPFSTVPTSVSATGPRSAHKEGKNYICITRKTALGAYMRRCKDVIIKDGYAFCFF
jgi:hypothetical protein